MTDLPRGWRNNNPGNMRPLHNDTWRGEIPPDTGQTPDPNDEMGSYSRFESPVWGIRAMIRDCRKKRRRGLNTIRKIKEVYAPAADGNDVAAYARVVANTMSRILGFKIGPDDALPPDTVEVRIAMAKAMVLVELGNPYNFWRINNAIVMPYWYSDTMYLEAAELEMK